MGDSEALFQELLETFRLEAQDHIDALCARLVALEHEEEPARRREQVEGIFRHMHTLKGAAHAVNLIDVAARCQELESLLSDLKRGDIPLELGLFDRLHRDIDLLSARIFARSESAVQETGQGSPAGLLPQGAPGAASAHERRDTPAEKIAAAELRAAGMRPGELPAAPTPAAKTAVHQAPAPESLECRSFRRGSWKRLDHPANVHSIGIAGLRWVQWGFPVLSEGYEPVYNLPRMA